jgi:hypothetical protein
MCSGVRGGGAWLAEAADHETDRRLTPAQQQENRKLVLDDGAQRPMLECMRPTRFTSLLRSVLVGGLVACGDGSLDPLPLSITLEASRTTAAPGQPIDFVVTAQGGTLLGITIDYGDDTADQRGTSGARTA